jgi:hypothetical protein
MYARRRDVKIHTKLVRPDVRVVYSLDQLAAQAQQLIKQLVRQEVTP